MIVAAANPQGSAILTPQIKERFIWYPLTFDKNSWKRYMSKFLISDAIFDQLCQLVQNESFTNSEKNYLTPRSIEKAIKMMVRGINTPYESKLKPILNILIDNTTGQDIVVNPEYTFKAGEKISWLTLQKLMRHETITE